MSERLLAPETADGAEATADVVSSVAALRHPAALLDDGLRFVAANPAFCSLVQADADALPGALLDESGIADRLIVPGLRKLLVAASAGAATGDVLVGKHRTGNRRLPAAAFRLPAAAGRRLTLVTLPVDADAAQEPPAETNNSESSRVAQTPATPLRVAMQALHRALEIMMMLHDSLMLNSSQSDRQLLLPLCERALQSAARALSDLTGTLAICDSGGGETEASPGLTSGRDALPRFDHSAVGDATEKPEAYASTAGADVPKPRQQASAEYAAASATWRQVNLTPRERRVTELVIAGYTNKSIAAELGISQRTVEHHRRAAMQKSGARSVCELVRMGIAAARTAGA